MDIPETKITNVNLLKHVLIMQSLEQEDVYAQEDILSKGEDVYQIMIIIIVLLTVISMESHAFATEDLLLILSIDVNLEINVLLSVKE
jgi:hypothetical protein